MAAPVAAFTFIDYVIAFEAILTMENKMERMMKFSNKTIGIIRDKYGVPEPFDKAVFVSICLLSTILM